MNPNLFVTPDVTLLQAMEALTKGEEKIVFVVDDEGVLLGTLTDGDVRRFILAGNELTGSIRQAFNRDPIYVRQGSHSAQELTRLFQTHAVSVVPVLDEDGHVVDRVSAHDLLGAPAGGEVGDIAGVPVVIMAGGLGARLQPFTHVLPKPLVPIDGRPVIDHIIDRFRLAGATSFYVTIGHKGRILRAYLEDSGGGGLTFVHESAPLGTAGALGSLAGRFKGPVIVTNCDVLIATNYRELLDFHTGTGCALTLVASVRTFRLPYGACAIGADGTLERLDEKPEMTRLVNTGLYVIDPALFAAIPQGRRYHMTTLIEELVESGRRVAVFPVSSESWIDVGQWEEYHRAARLIGEGPWIRPAAPSPRRARRYATDVSVRLPQYAGTPRARS